MSHHVSSREAYVVSTRDQSHNLFVAYLLWVFGFTGSHRFYLGKPISGTVYFLTFGLFLVGWLVDLFLIPTLVDQACRSFEEGEKNYTISWALLTFGGVFGLHRFYLGKVFTGVIYLLTGGLFLLGVLYDFWTLNEQVDTINRSQSVRF